MPEGTEALVVEILANAPEAASADRIVAEVTERMPQPTGDREVAFDAHAVVTGADIGFAMGDADDCLLVKRTAGVVEVLYVPSILLEPGELGLPPRDGTARRGPTCDRRTEHDRRCRRRRHRRRQPSAAIASSTSSTTERSSLIAGVNPMRTTTRSSDGTTSTFCPSWPLA